MTVKIITASDVSLGLCMNQLEQEINQEVQSSQNLTVQTQFIGWPGKGFYATATICKD